MRKLMISLGLSLALLGNVLSATFEITEDDMRTVEDTTKDLQSHVSLKDKKKAVASTQELLSYFRQVEGFYATKPDGADGVTFSRKTVSLAEDLLRQVNSDQFGPAFDTVQALSRSCKTCHDVYK